MELCSLGEYFGKLEMGLDISGEAFGNLPDYWHNWEKRSDSDEMEFGKLEGNFGK